MGDVGLRRSGLGRRGRAVTFSSSGGGAAYDSWSNLEEGLLRDVAAWLGPADARRARLVCRHWRASLNALSTRATTPPETGTVGRWKGCLNSMVCSLPALREVTVGGRLSDVGMQQLSELRRASQLRQLTIADGQALRDKSLQVLQQLSTLQSLHIANAPGLTSRALCTLSLMTGLVTLDLRGCPKLSWHGLREAWEAACTTYEAQQRAAVAGQLPLWPGPLGRRSSGGGIARRSSGGGAGPAAAWGAGAGASRLGRGPSTAAMQAGMLVRHPSGARAGGPAGRLLRQGSSSSGGGMAVAPAAATQQQQQQQQPGSPPAQMLRPGAGGGPGSLLRQVAKNAALANAGSPAGGGGGGLIRHASTAAHLATQPTGPGAAGGGGAAAAAAAGVWRQQSSVQAALQAYMASVQAEEEAARSAIREAGSRSMGSSAASSHAGVAGAPLDDLAAAWQRVSAAAAAPPSSDAPHRPPAMPWPRLRSVVLSCGDGFGARGGRDLAAVAAISGLTSLELLHCQQLSDRMLLQLEALPKLARLKLSGAWFLTDAGLADLAAGPLGSRLTSLALLHPVQISGAGLCQLGALRGLASLSLCITQDLGQEALHRTLAALPALRQLDLSYPAWGDASCAALVAAAPQLQVLKLHGAAGPPGAAAAGAEGGGYARAGDGFTAAGAATLRALTALTSLSIDACKGVEAGTLLTQGLLPPGMRSLALRGLAFGNMFGECVQLPACAAGLTRLVLADCNDAGDAGLRKVARFYPALRELGLQGCVGLSDAGLAAALAQLPQLQALDAAATRVSGAFVEPLLAPGRAGGHRSGGGAAAAAALCSLSLRRCPLVTDAGLQALASGLGDSLQALDVSGCGGVSDRGVAALLGGAMPHLGRLDVSGCKRVTGAALLTLPHYVRLVHTTGAAA